MGEIVDDKIIRTPATPERKILKKVSVSVSVSISTAPYSVYELRSRRRRGNNPASSPTTTFEDATSRNSSTVSDDVIVNNNNKSSNFPDSCCSSNISSSSSSSSSNASVKNNLGDLEVESVGETSLKFDDRNKSASEIEMIKCGEEESGGVNYTTTTKSTVETKSMMMMPSKSEIEDFFTSAENDLQKRFSDKYNFDIVKDVPLEGRYEWVEIKP